MKKTLTAVTVATVLVALAGAARTAQAQQSPFVTDTVYRTLVNEISGDIAFEHVRWLTHYHRPMGGSAGFDAAARYVEQKAKEYGLEEVRAIKLAGGTPSWTPTVGELWVIEPAERRLAFTLEVALSLADYSRTADVASADLVDVGEGVADRDYQGKSVTGAVVVATGALARVMEEAVWKRGALGIVHFTTTRSDRPDQVPWSRIPVENGDKTKKGTFAFVLSQRDGLRLRAEIAAAKTPIKVKAKVASTFHEPPTQTLVEAVITGTEVHDQDIVLTAHLQEERFSANDDGSGCGNVLEIARALKKAIDEGRLRRPRRDIRFWWTDEIRGEEAFFAANPDERRQFLANLNQDMVGARLSEGGRVQFVTRPPASRASFLGDVVESIVVALADGNTSFLAAGQARDLPRPGGSPAPAADSSLFSRPIFSRLGTRDPYTARVIPFHNNTDHQVFNLGVIGVPGVTFTNWPDEYIHSSDDDLWQVDPTQLKRNAVAVASAAYYLATLADDGVPGLLTQVYGAGLGRIAADTTGATRLIAAADAGARPATYARAVALVREASRRERQALESTRVFVAKGGQAERMLNALVAQLPSDAMAEAPVVVYYTALTGEKMAPAAVLTADEKTLASRVPVMTESVKMFLDGWPRLERPTTLHPLMVYETLNFADGTRSVLDVFRAVSAEAESAGAWYYGTVAREDVEAVLASAEKVGLVTYKEALPAKR
jgi:Zn-dependent M28 family amino/carboxypeptidase